MFRMQRRALLTLADTGACQLWHAQAFVDDGYALPACHDRGPHTCTGDTCDGWWRWLLTDHGRHMVWLLRAIGDELRLDEAPPLTQLEIPGVAA
ncbi:hypothetical protein [Corynebacterium sp.]|uniref:hypothetical protein n=1 Tax=Corynebacterium sp. TaxID=1720 RepID=UPI0025BE17FC|nr:hypothetical protein [Corynebacterium sp.]